jgi:hypothetical protein
VDLELKSRGAFAIVACLLACGGPAQQLGTGNGGTQGTGDSSGASSGAAVAECGADGTDSYVGDDGLCYCNPDTTWVDPFDPHDVRCGALQPRPLVCDASDSSTGHTCACDEEHAVQAGDAVCSCAPGYTWCSANTSVLRCCLDTSQEHPAGGTSSTGATTGADATTDGTTAAGSTG